MPLTYLRGDLQAQSGSKRVKQRRRKADQDCINTRSRLWATEAQAYQEPSEPGWQAPSSLPHCTARKLINASLHLRGEGMLLGH